MRVDQIRRILARAAADGTLNRWAIQEDQDSILIANYCHVIKVPKNALQLDVNELLERGIYRKDLRMWLNQRDGEMEFHIIGELLPRHAEKRLYELYCNNGNIAYVQKDLLDEYGEGVQLFGRTPRERLRIWKCGEGTIGALTPMDPDKVRGLY